ncbi:ABC transporter ATP-binding protein [Actinoplanes sp. NPDC051851]|uniref:ABC transporter ATP-binding protein n=1 Tax=Actinoplanes sp. NPDC051851 TaxID=3154753 RepID=UPI00343CF0EE
MAVMLAGAENAWPTIKRFWPLAEPDRSLIFAGGALAVLAAAAEVVAVYLFGVITDDVLTSGDVSAFWAPAATWLVVAIVGAVATFVGGCLVALAGERFLLRLRDRTFAHVQRVPLDFLDQSRLGDLMTRLTDDIESVEGFVVSGMIRTGTALVSVVAFATCAFLIRWELALAACALIPLFWLVSTVIGGRFQAAAAEERAGNGGIATVVEESLSNQAVIRAYNRQADEQERLHRQGTAFLRARMAETRLGSMYGPLVGVVETVCVLAVLGMGAWELSAGRISLGGLLSFAAYLGYLYPPIQSLGQFSLSAAEAAAAVERLDDVLTVPPSVDDRDAPDNGWRARGRVDVVDVGFRYTPTARPTLERLTFGADPGELVLLAGPSGAGKSTVTKLLLRFYDPGAGRIMIDGVDIRLMPLRTLRSNVTLLHQESQLFSGSVYDNIAYGRPSASSAEVLAAARAADAHDFVSGLPEGYRTDVGHRGRLLSGGQRQRVAIARALLRDTPILVLDEPTTGLDRESAARIMGPLRRLMSGRTTILITHDTHLDVSPTRVVHLPATPAARPPIAPATRPPAVQNPAAPTGADPAVAISQKPASRMGRHPAAGAIPAEVSRFIGRAETPGIVRPSPAAATPSPPQR